ncbi:MAG: glycosyltransferase family 4 protein [Phycisphaerae bacterium]|nr:glycosyltransferase family 4 protein [Phycisphaerae bacterium]
MNIVQLTPGTGNFYCGSCIRDNALVQTLGRMGHEVGMVPLYLPHVLDETAAANDTPIFMGGINVYLQQKSALFRHTPRWLDRLFDTRRFLRWAADRSSMTKARDLGELALSMVRGEEGRQNKELSRLIGYLRDRPDTQVICLSNVMLIGLARRIRAELDLPVVCTLQGEDGFLDSLDEPYRQQAWDTLRERASDVDAFVAVSDYYGQRMTEHLDLDPSRVHVVHNGIDLNGYHPPARPSQPPSIGYLARLSTTKGLDQLVDAFLVLKAHDRVPDLRLKLAGAMTGEDEGFVETLRRQVTDAGLAHAVEFHPNLSRKEKIRFLQSLTVFSVPATYGESFGLYLLEAWAAGLPVVQPRHAAFPELLEATGGGVLCEPNDPQALADAIEILLLRPEEAHRLGQLGRRRVEEAFTLEHMAEATLSILEQVVAHPIAHPA